MESSFQAEVPLIKLTGAANLFINLINNIAQKRSYKDSGAVN